MEYATLKSASGWFNSGFANEITPSSIEKFMEVVFRSGISPDTPGKLGFGNALVCSVICPPLALRGSLVLLRVAQVVAGNGLEQQQPYLQECRINVTA